MAERAGGSLGFWFDGFRRGMSALGKPERERVFRSCAQSCLAQGPLEWYGAVFEEACGDLDAFFHALGAAEGVRTAVLEPGRRWELMFEECSCPLCAAGYARDPAFCTCSRQSVLVVMHELWASERFCVELLGSILAGDAVCTLRIERMS